MWGFHDGMGWWMVFGGLWTIVFWGALIFLVVWLASRVTGGRGGTGGQGGSGGQRSPSDIARERLARGEISTEEFDRVMAKLRESERT